MALGTLYLGDVLAGSKIVVPVTLQRTDVFIYWYYFRLLALLAKRQLVPDASIFHPKLQ